MTKQKWKTQESSVADRLENAIIAIGASSYKPRCIQYQVPPHEEHLEWIIDKLRVYNESKTFVSINGIQGVLTSREDNIPGIVSNEAECITDDYFSRLKKMGLVPRYATAAMRLRSTKIDVNGKVFDEVNILVDRPSPGTTPRDSTYPQWYLSNIKGTRPRDSYVCEYPGLIAFVLKATDENWSVAFTSSPTAPAVRMLTCGDGVAGLFRLREKESSLTRRKALQHWVRDHHRKLPDGSEVDVKGHLRGTNTFDWFGMRCCVVPPLPLRHTVTMSTEEIG